MTNNLRHCGPNEADNKYSPFGEALMAVAIEAAPECLTSGSLVGLTGTAEVEDIIGCCDRSSLDSLTAFGFFC